MSVKTIHVCDGCGKHLEFKSEIYKLDLTTDRFWNGVEMDYLYKSLEFCGRCAGDIKNVLLNISKKEDRSTIT